MTAALRETWGNPSSIHHEGRTARHVVERAREAVGTLVGAPPEWVTFTSGGTEAINAWLRGRAAAWQQERGANAGRPVFLTTSAEHPAVRMTLEAMARSGECEFVPLVTDLLGRLNPDAVRAAIAALPPGTVAGLAAIAAHNETGATQDIAALAQITRDHGVPFFADGVQWTGRCPLNLAALGLAGWAISFHKLGGPKGVGALVAPPGVLTEPLIHGGPQERRRRAGTENVPGIAGAAVAARLAADRLPERILAWRAALAQIRAAIKDAWPDCEWVHDPDLGLPQTLLVKGAEMVQRLDLDGIAAATGSACASGAVRASEALLGAGWPETAAQELVRFSLPVDVPADAAERLHNALKNARSLRAD
jgi:cysteine desulfurase